MMGKAVLQSKERLDVLGQPRRVGESWIGKYQYDSKFVFY
jgi:hypothetical protein